MIIRGGFNTVYPREVEEIMMIHPAISLSLLSAYRMTAATGEEIAFVILKDGANATLTR